MPSFHINRSAILARLLLSKGWSQAEAQDSADFAMWFPYDGDYRHARLATHDIEITRVVDDKLELFRLLQRYQCDSITPAVFVNLASYLSYLRERNQTPFCFLKSTHGTAGEEVFFFNQLKSLVDFLANLSDFHGKMIIQEGVRPPALIDKRKFKLRVFVALDTQWRAHIYQQGLVIKHTQDYDSLANSQAVHLSPNEGDVVLLSNDVPEIAYSWSEIEMQCDTLCRCLRLAKEGQSLEDAYQLFGLDYVFDAQWQPWLIEANAYPNLDRVDPKSRKFMQQVIEHFYDLVIAPYFFNENDHPSKFKLLNKNHMHNKFN